MERNFTSKSDSEPYYMRGLPWDLTDIWIFDILFTFQESTSKTISWI